ncbi:MAG TPA: YkgJ family cysteine cluster protein [Steroidobacteraceae bacterium]
MSGVDIHFKCVQCAACCHRTKIPVTVAEAIDWLRGGHQVQVICEASPWIPQDEEKADHLMRRSFAAASGSMRVRMTVTLVANINGACPNLLADLRCGIYERRPLVCRIYPVETNPFVQLETAKKGCPPEAWSLKHPLLQRDGRVTSAVIREDVRQWREVNVDDVQTKLNVFFDSFPADGGTLESAVRLRGRKRKRKRRRTQRRAVAPALGSRRHTGTSCERRREVLAPPRRECDGL